MSPRVEKILKRIELLKRLAFKFELEEIKIRVDNLMKEQGLSKKEYKNYTEGDYK